MPRLIDEDKAKEVLTDYYHIRTKVQKIALEEAFSRVPTVDIPTVDIPTVDAEPVRHGRWGKTGQSFVSPNKFRNYFCSECGLELDEHIRLKPNYCPNCGAKMDGGEDE